MQVYIRGLSRRISKDMIYVGLADSKFALASSSVGAPQPIIDGRL